MTASSNSAKAKVCENVALLDTSEQAKMLTPRVKLLEREEEREAALPPQRPCRCTAEFG